MKAMLLAAGLGTRLRPYSLHKPKPLFPVLNIPLLQLTLARLKKAGFQTIIVNAFHLKDQIKAALEDTKGVFLQEEDKVFGTGGGLRMALPHFDTEPVLVVNGDIYHTIDYQQVYKEHCNSGTAITMVLHDLPRFNNVTVDAQSRVTGFGNTPLHPGQAEKTLAFTGIHVIQPRVLQTIPPDANYSIIDCYTDFLEQNGIIRAHIAHNHYWTDMGTPEDYLQLHAGLLHKKIPFYEELAHHETDSFVVTQDAEIGRDVRLLDWVSIGSGVTIGNNSTLQRVVVWDNAVVPAGANLKDTIITGFTDLK